jgi:predicted RNase H-like nuclease (RuvC/YqgF family)
VEAGVELAKKEVEACQKDVSKFKDEMAQLARQRDAVAAHREAVKAKLAEVQQTMTATMTRNRELVGEIARIQLEATRKIDLRTERMAQLTPAQ